MNFIDKYHLNRHIQYKHSENQKLSCPICNILILVLIIKILK
jgi:hypothetical protein